MTVTSIITVSGGRAVESENILFTVKLSAPSSETVSVKWRTGDSGSAEDDGDFEVDSGTVIFSPGQIEKTVIIKPDYYDADNEIDESVELLLYEPVNATLANGNSVLSVLGWMLDNDGFGQDRAISVSNPTLTEGDAGHRIAVFTVSLSRPLGSDQSFDFRTIDISARAGQDYVEKSGKIQFLAGQTEATISVPIIGDSLQEDTEIFGLVVDRGLNISEASAANVGYATILDDETTLQIPVVNVLKGSRYTEGVYTWVEFRLALSNTYGESVSVDYNVVGGTASLGDDFYDQYGYHTSGSLNFAPGQMLKSIWVKTDSYDSEIELDESVILTVTNPVKATLAGGNVSLKEIAWILDNDGLNQKRAVHVVAPTVSEIGPDGSGYARFEIELSRPSTERLTFKYATADGTARAGSDYVAKSGTVVFEPGQTKAIVDVALKSDFAIEAAETFSLRLLAPFPIVIGSTPATTLATATILDATIRGGALDDVLVGTRGNDFMLGGDGNDSLYGGKGRDRIVGQNGDDRLSGGDGHDTLSGGSGNDVLRGGRDNDRLTGGYGNDKLFGGPGRDRLIGDGGADRLVGGDDEDVFIYRNVSDSIGWRKKRDLIDDFEQGEDVIDLRQIDANINAKGNQKFEFVAESAFSGTAGELRFKNERLEADVDGDGRADFVVIVDDLSRLGETDFLL